MKTVSEAVVIGGGPAGSFTAWHLSRLGIENTFSKANFYSPKGTIFSVRLERPVTCALNRELFDKFLAEKAEAAGARYRMGSRVRSLILDERFVKGIYIGR